MKNITKTFSLIFVLVFIVFIAITTALVGATFATFMLSLITATWVGMIGAVTVDAYSN